MIHFDISFLKSMFNLRTLIFIALAFSLLFLSSKSPLQAASIAPAMDTKPPILLGIPEGPFIQGSTSIERKIAYDLDKKAYKSDISKQQGWYEHEIEAQQVILPHFKISKYPITNAQYMFFINSTGYPAPYIDEETWNSYGTSYSYEKVKEYIWDHGYPAEGKSSHPVVLVTIEDAKAYAKWLSLKTTQKWRLPTEAEWEKAIRSADGRYFPWGNVFYDSYLNSADRGQGSTRPIGLFDDGKNPYGVYDGAGQVFEWTTTTLGQDSYSKADMHIVKGGSWDNKGCGMCRPAARHLKPADMKHILVGFRLVQE